MDIFESQEEILYEFIGLNTKCIYNQKLLLIIF